MNKDLKIKLVSFEDGIVCPGFRRISSFAKKHFKNVNTYIYNVSGSGAQFRNIFLSEVLSESRIKVNNQFINELLDADIVGFSGLSKFSEYIRYTISKIKTLNNNCFVIWGGVHATVFPEHAIKYADAVCIGEGEFAFLELLNRFRKGLPIDDTPNFWIKIDSRIIKNNSLPLMTPAQLSQMPIQDYSFDIFQVNDNEIVRLDKKHYVFQQGSKYTTLWSLGCPFKCTYCSNTKFISNNPENAKIRYPPVEYIIQELTTILKTHDYVNYIEFEDDNFMLIEYDDIKLLSELYLKHIGLPFFISGLHPLTFDKDKIDLLIKAGLKKVRMGIQSGSDRILSFYNRNTPRKAIMKSSSYLASLYPKIIPPFYDIILDNPFETEEDKMATISLLYEMKRPFLLYLYSLRTIPGTILNNFGQKNPQYNFIPIGKSYQVIIDTRYGFLAYFLALCRPPRPIFDVIVRLSKYNFFNKPALLLTKLLYVLIRGYWETKIFNFQPTAMVSPRLCYFLYYLMLKKRKPLKK
jgi:anaerobic magnesium-protoporphyrin IX monomethyl ester cyclase